MSKTIYKDPARFYVYAFLREDGSPYYIGKGQGTRAWVKRKISPDDVSRIVLLKKTLTESEAFDLECELIKFHGRKDLGTGILRNLTDGGEGPSGYKRTQEALAKLSGENHHMFGKTGEQSPNFGKHHTQDTLAKISGENNHMFGKKQTPETIAKRSAANTGKKHTPETIAEMSAAKTGEKNPNYGKVPSAETIAKRLATRKRNKEAKEARALHFSKILNCVQ